MFHSSTVQDLLSLISSSVFLANDCRFLASRAMLKTSAVEPSSAFFPDHGSLNATLSHAELYQEMQWPRVPRLWRKRLPFFRARKRNHWNQGPKMTGAKQSRTRKQPGHGESKRPRKCRADVEDETEVKASPVKRRRRMTVNDVHNSVLKVFVWHVQPNYKQPWSWPIRLDGVLRVVTNAHSVEHAALVQVKRHRHEQKFVAKVLCIGTDCDLALLDVPYDEFWKGLEPLDILPGLPKLQDSVSVVGYPTGGESLSVTQGVVSRIDLVEYAQTGVTLLAVQIDAAINSGNSGGPVVDQKGKCVGVAFQNLDGSDEDGAENIGYIIPTEIVRHFLEDYQRNGQFTGFGSAGIQTQALESPVLRQALGMGKTQSGVRVKAVEPASPAHGLLLPDDVLLSVDGFKVGNDGEVAMPWGRIAFNYLLNQHFPGETCDLQVLRAEGTCGASKKISVKVRLERNRDLVSADAGGPDAGAGSAVPRYVIAGGGVQDDSLEVTGGFRCQGYSCQGDQHGLHDHRSHGLYYILSYAWFLQADVALLECVANVTQFPLAQALIDHFAQNANMTCHRLVFDLQHQWPVRRNRFWCYLISQHYPSPTISAWPSSSEFCSLQDIMPLDALWSPAEEQQLLARA
eukprot:s349_g1.t1